MKTSRESLPRRWRRLRAGREQQGSAVDVVRSYVRRGHLAGTVRPDLLGADPLFPLLCCVAPARGGRRTLWLYEDDQGLVPPRTIGITRRVHTQLDPLFVGSQLVLQLPHRRRLTVRVTRAGDLPQSGAVHVGTSAYELFRRAGGGRRHALLTTPDGMSFPVRLHRRPIDEDWVLMPLSLRTLSGTSTGSRVQLSAIPHLRLWERQPRIARKIAKRELSGRVLEAVAMVLGLVLTGLRSVDFLVELALRAALRSPTSSLRTVQANPGDDDLEDTIRLHPAAFPTLGLRPGGQAIMTWADQRRAVRALEDHSPLGSAPVSSHVLNSVGLHLDSGAPPEGFPPHLVVRVPAPIRQALNIPPNTIVVVRRRLRTALVSQLNQLTIPVGGLILAAAAFRELRGWPLAVGALVALVLGLAPLRMPRSPRGQWP